MSFTQIDPDAAEQFEPRPVERVVDPLSEALGSRVYVRSHRIDLHLPTPAGRGPRLTVSRYYWDLEPPVAVDFRAEVRGGQDEAALKADYFRECEIRYVLAEDEWDEEAPRRSVSVAKPAGDQPTTTSPGKPQSAPRRPRSAPRQRR